jgi:hypothetical protein
MHKKNIEKLIIIAGLSLGALLLLLSFAGKKEMLGFIGTVLMLGAAGFLAFSLKE